MGERERRREERERRLAALSPEEREQLLREREEQRKTAATANGAETDFVPLATMDREERERLRREVAAESGPRLSTFQALKRLSRFARPHKWALAFGFLLLVLQTAMDIASPAPLAYSIDNLIKTDGVGNVPLTELLIAGGVVVLIAALQGLFSYLDTLVVNRAGRTIVRDIRAAMFDHVQKLSLQFHSRRRTGDLLLRISGDVSALQRTFTDSFNEILNSVVHLTIVTAIMLYIDWQIGLIALASVPLLFLYVKRYSSDIRNFTAAQRRREGTVASLFNEALGSTRLTRVFNREHTVRSRFEQESAASLELGMEASLKEERFGWALEILGALLTGGVMIFAVHRVNAGALTAGELVLVFVWIRKYYTPIRTGMKNASRVWRSLASAERVIELLDMEHGVTDAAGAQPAPRFKGEIEFRNVNFQYEPGQPLLRDVNVRLPAGRITAIVGPTGAGKTTLASMVPRLFDPEEGQVLIDGHDLREYTLESVRDQIGVVLQESTLLYASVADNIALGRADADRGRVEEAAWLSGAHDFIKDLPRGYETEVGERGETLSGGQRQLISIARTIIRDAPIIILDEPMTGLDAASAAQVRDGLERLMANRTVLYITHNLALVDSADYVLVMNEGRVVQFGTPEELRNAEGLFRELFRTQAEADSVLASAL